MICTWLVEIYLSKLNLLEDLTASGAGSVDTTNYNVEQKELEEEFKGFLRDNKVKYIIVFMKGNLQLFFFFLSKFIIIIILELS